MRKSVTLFRIAPTSYGAPLQARPAEDLIVPTDATRRSRIHEAMIRLADGDRDVMPQLVAELWPVLLAFGFRAVHNRDDAEDIAQETLLKIASRIADFDQRRDGLTWAFAIGSYEVKSHLKRIRR